MDHAEAREALELAAVEPGGVELLEAGDTPESAALAGHLLECGTCAAEWDRLRRTSHLLRVALGPGARAAAAGTAVLPPSELRERTLRYVREVGRPRPDAGHEAREATVASGEEHGSAPASAGRGVLVPPARLAAHRRRRLLGELAALAAAIALIVGLGSFAYIRDGEARTARRTADAVSEIAAAEGRLAADPNLQAVRLTAAGGGNAQGTLLISPSTGEAVMVASGLAAPPAGKTLQCWVDTPGGRQVLGELKVDGSLAYWWDWIRVPGIGPGSHFGVTAVPRSGSAGSAPAQPLLTGTLGS